MAIKRPSPPSPFQIKVQSTLAALLLGLGLGAAQPVFADNIPEVQRLIKQGQYPQALDKLESYLASKPRDAQGRFLKGLILTEMNKPAEAIAVFTRLTEDYPELPEPYNNLAVLYAQQKQFDRARSALEMAIRTHPSYAIAYENLGDIYAKLASQAYDKALQIDSANSGAQNKLALIRDLISTSTRPNVKPPAASSTPPAPVAPAVAPTVAATPTATVVSTTAGAAATSAPPPLAKQVSAAPAATSTPAAAPVIKADPATDEVLKRLSSWADAWAQKDVKAYLAHYASDFHTPRGMDRHAWEAERESRIAGKPGKITVSYEQPSVTLNGDKATVKFRQYYKAPGIRTSTTKTLVFARSGGKWLIVEELSR